MEVTLDEVLIRLKLPGHTDFFSVENDPSTKQFWGYADSESRDYEALPKVFGSDYMEIALKAKDIVAASEELRAILVKKWRVLDTTFWFYVGPAKDNRRFYINETDPLCRQAITLGSYASNLSNDPDHKRSANFFKKIQESDLIWGANWTGNRGDIDIYLAPEATNDRVKTYKSLLSFF